MNSLFILPLLAVIGFAQTAQAMKLSAVGVLESSQPSQTTRVYDPHTTFGAGALLEVGIMPMIGLEIGALSLKRKATLTNGATETTTEKNLYEFPALIRFNLGSSLSFGFGGYYAHYQGKIFEETTTGNNTTSAEYNYSDKFATTTDYGLATSVALGFTIAPLTKLLFDGRYTMGMKDNDTQGTNALKYNDFQLLSGLQIGF